MTVTFVSLFSGVGGFDLGLEASGWRCNAQVEWDRQCQQVLARHWPNVPRWGDVSTVSGAELPPSDAVVFGSPCQDLSVAGRRAGLDGARSGLFYEAIRIIKEMKDATQNRFPRFVIWENVAGALSSSGGRDFGAVLDAMAELGALDIAWRILDAQFFGVPQRRRRVFVVADLGGECAGAIHAQSESLRRHSAASDPTRQDIAGTLGGGTPGGGSRPDTDRMTFVKVTRPQTEEDPEVRRHETVAPTLNTMDNGGDTRATVLAFDPGVVGPLTNTGMSRARGTESVESNHVLAVVAPTVLAFDSTFGGWSEVTADVSPTVKVGTGIGVPAPPAVSVTAAVTAKWSKGTGGPAGDECQNLVAEQTQVRRLTPRECERLMGWPDDHTAWSADGTRISDSARYRMCGNGVASPVAEWLADQINTKLGAHQ